MRAVPLDIGGRPLLFPDTPAYSIDIFVLEIPTEDHGTPKIHPADPQNIVR